MQTQQQARAAMQTALDDGWYADADDRATIEAGLEYLDAHWDAADAADARTALETAEALCLAYQES